MSTMNLLYQRSFPVDDTIRVLVPTVGEILGNEDNYHLAVEIITAQPIGFMVLLDDAGIDFSTINDWDLFILLMPTLAKLDTHLILDGLDIGKFVPMVDTENNQVVLYDKKSGIRIDRTTHAKIAATLRKINHMERDHRKPGNEDAKNYMLERAREKAKRNKNRSTQSQLESLIVALVNTEQYKYNFESTLGLSIFQFYECVHQIVKKVEYDNRMHGVYAGTINTKNLSQDDLNWMVHK